MLGSLLGEIFQTSPPASHDNLWQQSPCDASHAMCVCVCVCVQGGLYENVSPEVMASARPLLTGNPAADADIIKFYQAKAALISSQPLPVHLA